MNSETVKAALFGLAVGDALGVPVEFTSRQQRDQDPVTGMRGHGTYDQLPGTWSDDTSMALCLLESLTQGLDYRDMMERFLRWAEQGYLTARGETFDMGFTTRKALVSFAQGAEPLDCGSKGEHDNGNGSLMRILPLALYLHTVFGPDFPGQGRAYEVIHRTSGVTHGHPISLISCGIYCAVANQLIQGKKDRESLAQAIRQAKDFYRQSDMAQWLPRFQRVEVETLSNLPRDQVESGGYALYTLEAALWCLLHTETYPDCVLAAVNLGEDTDTTAAVAGGLAGLRYGLQAIPPQWLDQLAKREEIQELCEQFAASRQAPTGM